MWVSKNAEFDADFESVGVKSYWKKDIELRTVAHSTKR
jgi:hypothetical protein